MMGLAEPGMRVWLEPNDDPRKKLKFGWRLVELDDGHMAGIDTGVPNRIVGEALAEGRIEALGATGHPARTTLWRKQPHRFPVVGTGAA
jgi:sugar fermentation stimulation protein A